MANHNETGFLGETLAQQYFTQNGYTLLHQNWRYRHWEVDLIASKNDILHFIEIKTRKTRQFGFPEESVDKKKIQYLKNAAREFLHQNPQWQKIQFDILSIFITKNKLADYFLIEDIN